MRRLLIVLTLALLCACDVQPLPGPFAGCLQFDDDVDDAWEERERDPMLVDGEPTLLGGGELDIWEDIRVEFDRPAEGVRIELWLPDEGSLSGVVDSDSTGRNWTFQPDELLRTSTEYAVQVAWDTWGDPTWGMHDYLFTTSDVGEPADPADAAGRVYVVDLEGARYLEPRGIAPLVVSLMDGEHLFVGVDGAPAVSPDGRRRVYARLFASTPCWPTGRVHEPVALWWDDPVAWGSPSDAPSQSGMSFGYLWDAEVSGYLAPGGGRIAGLSIAGVVDTSGGDELLGVEPGATCELLWETAGIRCETCPDGSGTYCVPLEVDRVQALPIEEVEPPVGLQSTTVEALLAELEDRALDDPDCPEQVPADCSWPALGCSAARSRTALVFGLILLLLAPRRRR